MSGGLDDWTVEHRGNVRIVVPVGRVDESSAGEFAERLIEVASAGGRLVIDLGGISYMSSRGLRALTLAQRKGGDSGAEIVLARPSAVMREILAISRYDMIMKIVDTVEDAFPDEA